MARVGRTLSSLWLSVGIVAVALVAVEADVNHAWKSFRHFLNPAVGKPDMHVAAEAYAGQDWVKAYWDEYVANVHTDWSPYVMWRLRPFSGQFLTIAADGTRATWAPPPAAKPVEIWMFGGSGLFGMGARDDHTIPSELARLLAPGLPAHITNFGTPGWSIAQEAIALAEELKAGRRPDAAIFYDGVNDAFATASLGRAGLPSNNANRVREFNLTAPERRGALLGEAAMAMLPRLTKMARRAAGASDKPSLPPLPEDAPKATADYMGATAEQIRTLAKATGFQVRFVLQPVLFSKSAKTPFETKAAEAEAGLAEPFAQIYQRIRSHPAFAGRDDFLDLGGLFDPAAEGVFIDFNHIAEPGNLAVAQAIQAAFAAGLAGGK